MATSPLLSAIGKLAIAGQQAGFTVEQMLGLLNAGIDIETLVHIIKERLSLQGSTSAIESRLSSCRWIMWVSTMLPDPPPGWNTLQEMARSAKTAEELDRIIKEMNRVLCQFEKRESLRQK